MNILDYNSCVKDLLQTPFFGKKEGHKNIKELLNRLDNPEKKLKFIHVAGTNGKGSVCAMLSYLYVEGNYRVGLFTSPHLVKINERIKINNKDINDNDFVELFSKVNLAINDMIKEGFNYPTFFEIIFAMALYYFVANEVELAIIETGIGGRLDTTNVISTPLISVITTINYDHIGILGDSIEKIALEKGGIIKKNIPVVLLDDKKYVKDTIIQICSSKSSKIHHVLPIKYKILKRTYKTIDFSLNSKYYMYKGLKMNIFAEYQIKNLATALTVIDVIKGDLEIDRNSIYKGINKFYWPGRMEVINENLIIDGAHNEAGIKEFVNTVNLYFKHKKITLLFTIMNDKDYKKIIKELSKLQSVEKVVLTSINSNRDTDLTRLKDEFEKNSFNFVRTVNNVEKAFYENYNISSNEILFVVGSLYLVGEVKKILRGGFYHD